MHGDYIPWILDMLELIWRFGAPVLDDEAAILPLVSALLDVPGLSPASYDLNQKEQWRAFSPDRIVVDALTQRTQLLRIRGEQPSALAMIALGKRDEQPTAIIRLPTDDDVDALVAQWTELYEHLPVESTLISSAQWRQALQKAGVGAPEGAGLTGMIYGWRRGAEPAGIAEIDAADIADTPVQIAREANHLVLRLARRPRIDDDAHRQALTRVARRLMRA